MRLHHLKTKKSALATLVKHGAIALCVLGAAQLLASPMFALKDVRDARIYGPFPLRNGQSIQIGTASYQVRMISTERMGLVQTATRRIYGPIQLIEGRLIEVGGRMYEFSRRQSADATPAEREEWLPSTAHRPPPRPEPIPIPEETLPEPEVPLTKLPGHLDELRLSLWYASRYDTPMKFKIDDQRANQFDLSRTTIGGELGWRGWRGSLHLSPTVRGKELLPQGMDVEKSKLGDGDGWRLAVGYLQPLMHRDRWLVEGGAYASVSRDSLKLATTSLIGNTSSNETVDVSYKSFSDDITVTEIAVWLDFNLCYADDWWGVFLKLDIQPADNVKVKGGLPLDTKKLKIKAERDQPFSLGGGAWLGRKPWRVFADFTTGADEIVRVGTMISL